LGLVLIFTIMFFACTFELFQNNLKERLQQMADQAGTGPWGSSFPGSPFSDHPFASGRNGADFNPYQRPHEEEIIDAEDVRRLQ